MNIFQKIFGSTDDGNQSANKKTIELKLENRGNGPGRAVDEVWESWKRLDNGKFEETENEFVLTNTTGEQFVAVKNAELFAATAYNQRISTDLKIFDVYEGPNPAGGYFILYCFKSPERRNEFVISSIMGVAAGSSLNFSIG